VPKDLGATRADASLARHFLLRIWGIDRKLLADGENDLKGVFGYAAMFQFLLDFWSLAVATQVPDQPVFPGRPGGDHRPFDSTKLLDPLHGWRTADEIMSCLEEEYWTTHPLRPCPQPLKMHNLDLSPQDLAEDRRKWARVGEVLERAKSRVDVRKAGQVEVREKAADKEDVKILADAMAICFHELGKVHVQFNEDLARSAKRRGLLKNCTVT